MAGWDYMRARPSDSDRTAPKLQLNDRVPSTRQSPAQVPAALRNEIIRGLSLRPRRLPPRLLYDSAGARLFDEITRLPEYYLTRTELSILKTCTPELATIMGPRVRVIEPGSGSGAKTEILLRALEHPAAYVAVDVTRGALRDLSDRLRRLHPTLDVTPIQADYSRPFDLVSPATNAERTIVFFPGSSIENFTSREAIDFLRHMAGLVGQDGGMILGADLTKDRATIEAAYNDSAGVTARFNLNVLKHVNRLLSGDFVEGEPIITEYSHKYSPEALDALIAAGSWVTRREWLDDRSWFSVRFLESRSDHTST